MDAVSRFSRQYLWLLSIPLLVIGLWAEWRDFLDLWSDSIIYTHGFLVLAGTLYLLFLRRDSLSNLRINGSPLALFLLAGSSTVLLLSQAADIRVFRLLLVPIMIVFWGWAIWGKGFLRTAAGPIMLLIFAVPVWDDLSFVLQHITVFFNDIFLQVAGIQATIQEFYIILEVGTFLVEGGCSGVRYLMVALFLGSFYGQLYYHKQSSTILLVVIAAILSMVSNWFRVFGIIVAGHYTDMETSLVEDHELFGWFVFLVLTLIPLFFISARLEPHATSNRTQSSTYNSTSQPKRSSLGWPVIASLLLVWPAILPLALQAETERVAQEWNPTLFQSVPGWSGPLPHATLWTPEYTRPDINLAGVYVSPELQQVQLQIVGYRIQTQNKELIFYGNSLFNQKEWQLVSEQKRQLENGYLPNLSRVNETIIQRRENNEQVIIWSWYEVGDSLTDSRLEAKLSGALNKISGDSRGALWALAGRCKSEKIADCDEQRAAFTLFLAQVGQ